MTPDEELQNAAGHETPSETSSRVPAIAQRPGKNGGRLRSGNPGNAGGGRPPYQIRRSCREDFDELRAKLVTIARSRKAKDADRIRAIDVLGRYGLGEHIDRGDVQKAVEMTAKEIRRFLPEEMAEALLSIIAPTWREVG